MLEQHKPGYILSGDIYIPTEEEMRLQRIEQSSELTLKFTLFNMGADVALTHEDTNKMSILADLAPVSDMNIWRTGLNLVEGTIITRNDKNYIVNDEMSHIALKGLEPENSAELFTEIKNDYAEWEQPESAHYAYMSGDKALYNKNIWVSLIDYNSTEPAMGSLGWELVTKINRIKEIDNQLS